MSDASTPDTLIGHKIGNYVATALLGRGGMGEVYLAEHPKIGRKVAIKVLAGHLLTTEFLASRFLAEAKAVARIDHPNVIDIYDYGNLDDGRLYYVMELLKGRELRAVIDERGTLSPAEVVPFLEQICAGLQAAHERGVIHRDLKPENVFVLDRRPLALKLLDFGIAKLLETEQGSGLTSSGMVMGTPLYIAPEQALGQPERISPRTDLYSLGVILYWMMSGRPPFQSDANAVLLAMHIRDAPPPLRSVAPAVPPGIAALVERCLAKEPGDRPGSAAELAHLFGQTVAASTTGPPTLAGERAAVQAPQWTVEPAAPGQRRTTFTASAGESIAPPSAEFQTLTRRPVMRGVAVGAVALAITVGVAVALLHGPRRAAKQPRQTPLSASASSEPDTGRPGVVAPAPTNPLAPGGAPAPAPAGAAEPAPAGAAAGAGASGAAGTGAGGAAGTGAGGAAGTGAGAAAGTGAGAAAGPGGAPGAGAGTGAAVPGSVPRHRVAVRAHDPLVSCSVRVADRELPQLADPCLFQATAGQRVRLEVNRSGFKPLVEEWTVEGDREIPVEVRTAERRIARAGEPAHNAGAAAGDATRVARRHKGATPARPPAAKKLPGAKLPAAKPAGAKLPAAKPAGAKLPAAKPAGATSGSKPRPERKHVGEGTMEMDD